MHAIFRRLLLSLGCLLTLALPGCSSSSTATVRRSAALDPYAGPRPIAVQFSTSIWNPAGHVPTPHIAVYEDGQVIFTSWVKAAGRFSPRYLALTLTPAELTDLRQQVHALTTLRPQRDSYDALAANWHVTDASQTQIYVRDSHRQAAISVHALGHHYQTRIPLRPYQEGGPPPALMALHHRLATLAKTSASAAATPARPWAPRYVEVRLLDETRNLSTRTVAWPTDWPALTSSRARPLPGGGWSILIDGSQLPRVRRVLTANADYAAVTLNGRTWAALWRPMLPGQHAWTTAFHKRSAAQARRLHLRPSIQPDPWSKP